MNLNGEVLLSNGATAKLVIAAALLEETERGPLIAKTWINIARSKGMPVAIENRYRKAERWGATDEDIDIISNEISQYANFGDVARMLGWQVNYVKRSDLKPGDLQ